MKKATLILAVLLFGAALEVFAGQAASTSSNVPTASAWAMKMRIFEGIREGASEPVKVVTSSYLQYRITATIQTEFDLAEEQKQIRKTFNLRDANLLTEADFSWPKDKYEKTFHIFRLDSKEYLILITPIDLARKLRFRIEVFEQSGKEKTNLLDSEFSIPEKNIAVFGFEDTKGKPYFLSFRIIGRPPMGGVVGGVLGGYVGEVEAPVRAEGEIGPPQLLKRVDPIYPEIARKASVEGIVILEATTDIYGHVMTIKVLRSIPLLDQAAIDAVRQWVYEPVVINGKPRGMTFTTTVTFTLDGTKAKAEVIKGEEPLRITSGIEGPKRIREVKPRYPEVARQARVEGSVILEATTDIYGRVKNIKVLRSIPLLDQAAIDAVRQWVYEPIIINGKPREVSFTVTVLFKLEGRERLDTFRSDVTPPTPPKEAKGGVAISREEEANFMKLPPVKVEGGIKEPQRLKSAEPIYPEEARKAEIQGVVILEAETDIYGRVMNVKVLRSVPGLDQAAIDAVRQWIYEPLIIDGQPRRAIFTVTVDFTLK
jgi:TonB family protein